MNATTHQVKPHGTTVIDVTAPHTPQSQQTEEVSNMNIENQAPAADTIAQPATAKTRAPRALVKVKRNEASFRPGIKRAITTATAKPKHLTFSIPASTPLSTEAEMNLVRAEAVKINGVSGVGQVVGYGLRDQTYEIVLALPLDSGKDDDALLSDTFRALDDTGLFFLVSTLR